ncbi:hypothetical protein ACF0H5_008795 [Mactra antiquata]
MRSFAMILYTINACVTVSMGNNLTFLSELKELCPYTPFCGENAQLTLPKSETKQPCCRPCSCKPDCEMSGNCCFDYVSNGTKTHLRQCLSPVITYIQSEVINYIMVSSCPTSDGKDLVCPFNTSDVSSFAPVVSMKTGEIYVNPQCASCNGVTDGVPWKLAVACPFTDEDYLISSSDMLFLKDTNQSACHLMYVPPATVNVESRECRNDVVRQCNVTGQVTQWSIWWEYCPMFNATFYTHNLHIYGNIFCFICNEIWLPDLLCRVNNNKSLSRFPFIAMLEEIHFEDVSGSEQKGSNYCDEVSVMVHSFTTACRQVICPWGQFRVADTCGYHSKRWVGGSFSVILKLTPLQGMPKIDIAFVRKPEIMNDTESSWIKQNAMKVWQIKTLYKPTVCGKYVEFFLVFASYPYKSVNPSKLRKNLGQALLETWYVEVKETRISLSVEMDPFQNYQAFDSSKNYYAMNASFTYLNEYYNYLYFPDVSDGVLPYFLYDVNDRNEIINNGLWFLSKLFFCEQIELYVDEYDDFRRTILFKVTNKTLHASDFMVTNTGSKRVCLSQFLAKSGECKSFNLPIYYWLLIPCWHLILNKF